MTDATGAARTALDAAATLAEQGFLAAGRSLEQAVAILDSLLERFALCTGEASGGALDATRREVADVHSHLASLIAVRDADAAALNMLGSIVAAVRGRIAALRPIAQEVDTLSLSARVVAGGIGEAAAGFVAFAGSVREAARRARSYLEEAGGALNEVAADLTAIHGIEVSAPASGDGGLLATLPARLAGSLQSLAARQRRTDEAATKAHDQSETVRRQVAEQIIALQLGDITRQRIEHVAAAAELVGAPQRTAGCLLAAQLNDTADELLREGGRIEGGLRRLAEAARSVRPMGLHVQGSAEDADSLAALEVQLRQTDDLFEQLRATDAATERRMATVLEAAGTLGLRMARVQAVQEDIRIMGLNATLKCGGLGASGRALAAVAQELRRCSGRFGGHAALVQDDLDRLAQIAGKLCDQSRRDKHAALARLADELLVPLQRVRALEARLTAVLAQLESDAEAVGGLVDAAVSEFAVRHALAEMLRAAATEFAGWQEQPDADFEILDRIAGTYTMARERDVHQRFAPLPQWAEPADVADALF